MSHRPAELRSIALHEIVASRIADDPELIGRARVRVASWLEAGDMVQPASAARWAELLDGPLDVLQRELVADSQQMRDLRQVSPFAGVVSSAERWRIIREVG